VLKEAGMNDAALSLMTGLISGLVSAVITFFVTRAKVRLDLTAEYDRKLRSERLDAYRELFKRLKPLARYSPEKPLTYKIIKETSEDLRDWYFDIGGIYLSKESRKPYFHLKGLMQKIIDNEKFKDDPKDDEVAKEFADLTGQVLAEGKLLREYLTNDIGTRRGPFV
jgi:hypothetical protein